MASYYSRETLQVKVKQMEEATNSRIELIGYGKWVAIQSKDGPDFGWASWYRTVDELIIYIDGFLAGMKYGKQ